MLLSVDGKHLKQIKKIDIQQWLPTETAFWFSWWPMKKAGKNEKKYWVEEVGEKKMAVVLHTVMIV